MFKSRLVTELLGLQGKSWTVKSPSPWFSFLDKYSVSLEERILILFKGSGFVIAPGTSLEYVKAFSVNNLV